MECARVPSVCACLLPYLKNNETPHWVVVHPVDFEGVAGGDEAHQRNVAQHLHDDSHQSSDKWPAAEQRAGE